MLRKVKTSLLKRDCPKYGGYLPKTVRHMFTGYKWYCSSAPVTSMETSCNTSHRPWTGVEQFLEDSNHVVLILDNTK